MIRTQPSRASLPPARYRANEHQRSLALRSGARIAVPLAMLILPLLSGCGSTDNGVAAKPANQILAAARTAAQNASSVHIVTSSKITHGGSINLDARLSKDQGHARLSLLGISMEAVRTANTIYVKGNKVFAARLGGTLGVKVPADTWLKGPAKSALGQAGAFTDITTELPLILSGTGRVTKGSTTNVNGRPAIMLKLTRKLYDGTLYVATTGQPYPLTLIKKGQETGKTTFTGWNDPIAVTPPANAVDISQLQPLKKGH